MDYKEFEGMSLNPFAVPKGKFMDHYRVFRDKRFWVDPETEDDKYTRWLKEDKDILIRFVVLLIDPESPFYDEKNYDMRIQKCKKALGIKKDSQIEKDIDYTEPLFNTILFEFFKTVNSHLYETWFSMKLNVHQMNKYLRMPPMPDKNGSVASDINARRQLSQVITELTYELIEIEYQLFPDTRLQRLINERSVDDGLGGYAEQFAENPKYD